MFSLAPASLLLSAFILQSPGQSLTQDKSKPDQDTTKPDKTVIIVIPRPVIVPGNARFVVVGDGVFLDLAGVYLAIPGGGASGCFGDLPKKPYPPRAAAPAEKKPEPANPETQKKP